MRTLLAETPLQRSMQDKRGDRMGPCAFYKNALDSLAPTLLNKRSVFEKGVPRGGKVTF